MIWLRFDSFFWGFLLSWRKWWYLVWEWYWRLLPWDLFRILTVHLSLIYVSWTSHILTWHCLVSVFLLSMFDIHMLSFSWISFQTIHLSIPLFWYIRSSSFVESIVEFFSFTSSFNIRTSLIGSLESGSLKLSPFFRKVSPGRLPLTQSEAVMIGENKWLEDLDLGFGSSNGTTRTIWSRLFEKSSVPLT